MLKETSNMTLFTCIFIYCVASVVFLNYLFPSDASLYVGTDETSKQHRKTTYNIFQGLGWGAIAIVLVAAALETVFCAGSTGSGECVWFQLTPMLVFYFTWCVNTVAITLNTSFVADTNKINSAQLKKITEYKCLGDGHNQTECDKINHNLTNNETDIEAKSSTLYDALSMIEYSTDPKGDNYKLNQNALGLHYVSGLFIIFGYLGFFNTVMMVLFDHKRSSHQSGSLGEQLLYHKFKAGMKEKGTVEGKTN